MLEKGTELFQFEQELFQFKKKWIEQVNKDNVDQAKDELLTLLNKYSNKAHGRPYAYYMALGVWEYLDFTAREGVFYD